MIGFSRIALWISGETVQAGGERLFESIATFGSLKICFGLSRRLVMESTLQFMNSGVVDELLLSDWHKEETRQLYWQRLGSASYMK